MRRILATLAMILPAAGCSRCNQSHTPLVNPSASDATDENGCFKVAGEVSVPPLPREYGRARVRENEVFVPFIERRAEAAVGRVARVRRSPLAVTYVELGAFGSRWNPPEIFPEAESLLVLRSGYENAKRFVRVSRLKGGVEENLFAASPAEGDSVAWTTDSSGLLVGWDADDDGIVVREVGDAKHEAKIKRGGLYGENLRLVRTSSRILAVWIARKEFAEPEAGVEGPGTDKSWSWVEAAWLDGSPSKWAINISRFEVTDPQGHAGEFDVHVDGDAVSVFVRQDTEAAAGQGTRIDRFRISEKGVQPQGTLVADVARQGFGLLEDGRIAFVNRAENVALIRPSESTQVVVLREGTNVLGAFPDGTLLAESAPLLRRRLVTTATIPEAGRWLALHCPAGNTPKSN